MTLQSMSFTGLKGKMRRLLGLGCSRMRHLFAVPWLTPIRRTLLGIGVVVILMFGLFALVKVTNGGRQAPG